MNQKIELTGGGMNGFGAERDLAETLWCHIRVLLISVKKFIQEICGVCHKQNMPLTILSGVISFFAFALGAYRLAIITSIVFFVCLRPFTLDGSEREVELED